MCGLSINKNVLKVASKSPHSAQKIFRNGKSLVVLRHRTKNQSVTAVFVGGGTPSRFLANETMDRCEKQQKIPIRLIALDFLRTVLGPAIDKQR